MARLLLGSGELEGLLVRSYMFSWFGGEVCYICPTKSCSGLVICLKGYHLPPRRQILLQHGLLMYSISVVLDLLKDICAKLGVDCTKLLTYFTGQNCCLNWFRYFCCGGSSYSFQREITCVEELLCTLEKSCKELLRVIAYSKDGDDGMKKGSSALNDKSKSLVLVNYFRSVSVKLLACGQNSQNLIDMLQTCYGAAGNRWANFVTVDYYKRSEGGGAFQAVDRLNGELLCGCNDVQACKHGSSACMRRGR